MASARKQEGIDNETRRLLIKLARRSKTRSALWTRERPTDWEPQTVQDPRGGFFTYFTDVTAWEFIALKLEEHPVKTQQLEKPLGARGYVLEIPLQVDRPDLYVKLELNRRRNHVFGRSFHYSRRD